MAKRPVRPRDPMQLAKLIGDIATGNAQEAPARDAPPGRRKGGQKGGKARARKLTAGQRSDIARLAAEARWKKSR